MDIIPHDEKEVDDDELFELIDKLREIISEPLKLKDYKTILEVGKYDTLLIEEKYNILKNSNNKVENVVGWIIRAIEDDYTPNVSKKPKESKGDTNKKNNFHYQGERVYSDEEIAEIERRNMNR